MLPVLRRYEDSSVLSTAAMLIILNYITDAMKVFNPYPLMMRYWVAWYVAGKLTHAVKALSHVMGPLTYPMGFTLPDAT